MSFLARLCSPCLIWHGDRVRARDEQGRLCLRCTECGDEQIVLQSETVKGPAHQPEPVRGQPTGKAVIESWFGKRKVG